MNPVTKGAIKPLSMERTNENSAEIVLYGDIVSKRPTDWWTGERDEGQYIILSEFLETLKQVENVTNLTIRLHSVGGDALDAITIHNRLKAMAAKITVIVDGVAMSGGSLIMCSGDVVKVYPGSLIMIHKSWCLARGNADELRRVADCNDTTDRSQAAIYHAKTGIGTEEIMAMMSAETYMTGQEAVDKGFADELVEGSSLEIAASADRRTLYVSARPVWVSTRKDGIPAALNIPTVKSGEPAPVEANTSKPAMTGSHEGGIKPMANTIEELQAEYPELTQQLVAQARAAATPDASAVQTAVQAEQRRIQDIDAVADLFDHDLVQAAKYGKDACTAQELTYRAALKAKQQGAAFLRDLSEDAGASGAQGVPAAHDNQQLPGAEPKTPEQLMAVARTDVRALLGKKEG